MYIKNYSNYSAAKENLSTLTTQDTLYNEQMNKMSKRIHNSAQEFNTIYEEIDNILDNNKKIDKLTHKLENIEIA